MPSGSATKPQFTAGSIAGIAPEEHSVKFRTLFSPLFTLLAVLPLVALSGCGGSDDDDGSGQVRLVNATTDYASLDLYASDVLVTESVALGGVGSYAGFSHGDIVFKLKRADSGITSLATSRTVSSGVNDSLIAYSTGGTLRTVYVADSETAPTSGYGKLRIFNTSTEAGAVDMYVTAVGGSLDDVSAAASTIYGERFSSYGEISAGSYRVVITGAGDKTDIRLDIPSITLSDQQIATLILTSTPGGVLVHGLLLNQGSTATAMNNTSARIRLIANTTSNGVVAATVNGNVLSTGLKSPIVGSYTLIPAGALTTDIQVNGVSVPTSGLTATAGADLSLMVLGTPAAPQVTLLSDDNSPPLTSTYAKLRLVHGVNNLNGTVTLTADYSAVATDVTFGTASTPVSVLNSTTYRLESTSPVFSGEMYLATDVYLQSTHVYTVFMLGDSTTPLGVLRRDR